MDAPRQIVCYTAQMLFDVKYKTHSRVVGCAGKTMKTQVVVMQAFLSLMAMQVVFETTFCVTSDDKVGITTTCTFRWSVEQSMCSPAAIH